MHTKEAFRTRIRDGEHSGGHVEQHVVARDLLRHLLRGRRLQIVRRIGFQ